MTSEQTSTEFMLAAFGRYGNQTAVVTPRGAWSFTELRAGTYRMARAFQRCFIRRGDTIALLTGKPSGDDHAPLRGADAGMLRGSSLRWYGCPASL